MKMPKYNIGQGVYHITPDSPKGYILDISYSYLNKRHKYLIGFSYNDEAWCEEHEISTDKRFE